MRPYLYLLSLALFAIFLSPRTSFSLTEIESANGHLWDVKDNNSQDNGAINDGGGDAFDGYGTIRITVQNEADQILLDLSDMGQNIDISGFNLSHDGERRFDTQTPVDFLYENQQGPLISVTRSMYAPEGTDLMRYFDTFTNTSEEILKVRVYWGGDLGSDNNTWIVGSSSGDQHADSEDIWLTTAETAGTNEPSGDPIVGYIFWDSSSYVDYYDISSLWNGEYNDQPGFVFGLSLAPGESKSLIYFLFRGLFEGEENPNGEIPAAGEAISAANDYINKFANNPLLDFGDLNPEQLGQIANLSGFIGDECANNEECRSGFCTNGVCCNTACGGGLNESCTCIPETGAELQGFCTALAEGIDCSVIPEVKAEEEVTPPVSLGGDGCSLNHQSSPQNRFLLNASLILLLASTLLRKKQFSKS